MQVPETTRYCRWCNEVLRGRSDKKFCDINCRNSFHNQLGQAAFQLVKTINFALKKNRNILADLYQLATHNAVLPKEVLTYRGFQFQYHTEVLGLNKPEPVFLCYDYGYQLLPNEQVRISPASKDSFSSWYSAGGAGWGIGI